MNVWAQGWPARVLNMWFENIVCACVKYTPDCKLRVQYFENYNQPELPGVIMIDDERIPRNFYIDGLALFGFNMDPKTLAEVEQLRKGK